jgi:hypothetical protein
MRLSLTCDAFFGIDLHELFVAVEDASLLPEEDQHSLEVPGSERITVSLGAFHESCEGGAKRLEVRSPYRLASVCPSRAIAVVAGIR